MAFLFFDMDYFNAEVSQTLLLALAHIFQCLIELAASSLLMMLEMKESLSGQRNYLH